MIISTVSINIMPKLTQVAKRDIAKKPFCEKCGKQFSRADSLARHKQLHTGRFTYFCEKCKKGYNSSTAFKAHLDKHEGVTYRCLYCGKMFSQKQARDYHSSVHTGDYRFKCNKCKIGFNDKKLFEKHMENHQP